MLVNIELQADCGHVASVSASVLAAASPVWAERMALRDADDTSATVKSIESGQTAAEVNAFVGVITLLSPHPTMPWLLRRSKLGSSAAFCDVKALTDALALVQSSPTH